LDDFEELLFQFSVQIILELKDFIVMLTNDDPNDEIFHLLFSQLDLINNQEIFKNYIELLTNLSKNQNYKSMMRLWVFEKKLNQNSLKSHLQLNSVSNFIFQISNEDLNEKEKEITSTFGEKWSNAVIQNHVKNFEPQHFCVIS
jgi:hypothetical protein